MQALDYNTIVIPAAKMFDFAGFLVLVVNVYGNRAAHRTVLVDTSWNV